MYFVSASVVKSSACCLVSFIGMLNVLVAMHVGVGTAGNVGVGTARNVGGTIARNVERLAAQYEAQRGMYSRTISPYHTVHSRLCYV